MVDYADLIKRLREWPRVCVEYKDSVDELHDQAADAVEELFKAAKSMHTWIFLNSGDEQEAYDECHLSDELNVALGYGGSCEIRYERVGEDK